MCRDVETGESELRCGVCLLKACCGSFLSGQALFAPFRVVGAAELTLGANMALRELHRLSWRTTDSQMDSQGDSQPDSQQQGRQGRLGVVGVLEIAFVQELGKTQFHFE